MQKYFFIIFILLSFYSFSQNITICGIVQDTISRQPIKNANIMVYKIGDSVLIKKTLTNGNGFFSINNLQIDTVVLIISQIGYNDKLFYIPQRTTNVIDLRTIVLSPKTIQLNEVLINGYNNPVYYKHDTMIYLADSFKVRQNATVEDLLKKLPGLKVNTQGKITFQGKVITQLLVDGDDFFGKDVTIATRNLNANGVESVQIYEKTNEHNLEKDDKFKVLNLKLKENAKKGSFGEVSGASDFKNFYEGSIFANKFKGSEKVAISFAGGNTPSSNYKEDNIYKISESRSDDELDNNDDWNTSNNEQQKEGISKIFNSGLYYSNALGKKDKIGFNYTYTNNPLKILRIERSQFILKDTNYIANDDVKNFQKLENHSIDFKINHKINPLTELEIQPRFTLMSIQHNNYQETKFTTPDNTLTSKTNTNNINNTTNNTTSTNIILRRAFKNSGRLIRINYNASIQNIKSNGILTSYNTYYNSLKINDSINQQKINTGNTHISNVALFYGEPISKKVHLEFYYSYNYNIGVQNKETNKYLNGEYSLSDSLLTNNFKSKKIINDLGGKFTYKNNRQLFNIGSRFRHASINNINIISQVQVKQSINNILPYADYRYSFNENSHLNFNYNTTSDLPQIGFLQPINDNSNPNQIIVGNPNLLPTYNHNFNLSYDMFNEKSGKSLWSNLNISQINNDFAVYIEYDSLGRSIEKIINTNGNYNGSFSINSIIPFFSKLLELDPNVNFNYNKNTNYINSQKNISKNSSINAGLNTTITIDTLVFSIGGNFGYTIPTSTLNDNISKPYFIQNYSAALQLPLPIKFILESDITYTINNRRANGFNIDYFIWNMSLGKVFLKNENLIISVIGKDILNQNINTSRSVYNNVITDVKTNVVSRYFLLKVIFRLNHTGNNNIGK